MRGDGRKRGDGRIFRRPNSSVWSCAYCVRGKEVRESIGETDEGKAQKFLDRRVREVENEKDGIKSFAGPQAERIRISCGVTPAEERKPECDCLCCALERDFRLRGKASVQNLSNLKRVRVDFARRKAAALRAEQVDAYIEQRLDEGSAPAPINRVTQLLGQAFNLALRQKRLASAPFIRRLSEAGNVRQGFFSDAEVQRLLGHLPNYLQDFARFAYLTGMRKGEIRSLRWEDLDADVIRLRAENAKNGEARTVPLKASWRIWSSAAALPAKSSPQAAP